MRSLLITLLITIVFGSTLLQAQSTKPSHFLEGGLMLGASAYGGDLRSKDLIFLDQAGISFGVGLRYHLNAAFALRANLMRGTLKADDAKDVAIRQERGYSFKTMLTEFTGQVEWHPFGNRRYGSGTFKKIWSPYLFGGVGFGITNPDTDFNGQESSRISADRNSSEDATVILPFGAGVRIDLSEKVGFGIEYAYRGTRSDYLDGVSQAGNPNQNDRYAMATIQLWKRFGNNDMDGDGVADADDGCPEQAGPASTAGCPDNDLDGIANRDDACPDIAGRASLAGCPDNDGDGITDAQDSCPTVAGTRATNGCPDRDNDGVADADDNCPAVKGLAALQGCPDADADGIADADDRCPDQAGSKSLLGCPDSDGDGIADSEDKCPTVKGLNMLQGCPDADGDGISDGEDKCPNQAGLRFNDGCPVINEEDKEVLEFAARNIQFETGSDRIRPTSLAILDQVADILQRYPDFRADIGGHTDNVGDDNRNLTLSKSRAKSAYDYLVGKGIPASRMSYEGYGETQPIASNNSSAGRQENRRVVFKLTPG
jgi:outer membrane protein OmpA-like peptidoglycan-associated protein/opacity protein-like surface antigen